MVVATDRNMTYPMITFYSDKIGVDKNQFFFNKEDLEEVFDKIDSGEIRVHMNYSVLYCKNGSRLEEVRDKIGCYETLMPEKA